MLDPMDPATTTAAAGPGIAPWIVLGAVVGIALCAALALVGTLLLRPRRRPGPPPPEGWEDDDLPAFREAPPGFPGARHPRRDGWVSLAPAPVAAPSPAADRPARLLAGLTAGVLALIAVAALVAGLGRSEAATERPATVRSATTASVRYEGLVLERRAVGVTVTAPSLRLSTGSGGARASVTLPTWNCLADSAPADPAAADCAETPTQYAELTAPDLAVIADGDGLRVAGRFATYTRPNGGPPEPTGRTYALTFTVTPAGRDGADGEVRLGDDSAPAVAGVNAFHHRSG
jgi:hypothetical protein